MTAAFVAALLGGMWARGLPHAQRNQELEKQVCVFSTCLLLQSGVHETQWCFLLCLVGHSLQHIAVVASLV